ncbi:MAG: amidohydrolase family protein, partial [Candidatus Thermoplasmatota archaeon]|nr:amidohydrolase family protein [Candidatus Thermoplasmatota archaeon]
DKIGFLGPDVVAAHSVWLDQEEISILAKKGVKPSHNPVSNMKMGVGKAMPYRDMRNAGICPTLGTDGSASNNSLDMFQSMKFAALLQKFRGQPTALPCQEALLMATKWGAEALRIPTGEIKEGLEADIILVETKRHDMVPGHNPISNLVYSSSSSSVSHAICRGKLVMDDRKVEGEDIVLKKAQQAASELAKNVDAESKK